MGNPEKIEIEGLKTIHKLCKFGADHDMEGCTFTEIVERMFDELAKAKAVLEKDAVIKKLSDQLYAQEMKASAARVLCETACELLDDYAHQDAMVILNDLEQAMKEPAND